MALLFSAACGGAARHEPAVPARPAARVEYQFDWSPPCRVPVRERAEKKGAIVVMRYVVDLQAVGGGELEARLADFEMLEINGQDVTGPEWKEQIAPAVQNMELMPAMRVAANGAYLGTTSSDALLDRFIAEKHMSAEDEQNFRAAMQSPAMRAQMEGAMGVYWGTWVAPWIGWNLEPGTSVDRDEPTAMDASVTQHVHLEHQGMRDGIASLSMRTEISGPALKALIRPMLETFAKQAGKGLEEIDDLRFEGSRVTEVAVETEPATLRPRRAHMRSELKLTVEDRTVEQVEQRDTEWDWAHAQGCGAAQ